VLGSRLQQATEIIDYFGKAQLGYEPKSEELPV
jgi:hypothetical protein